MQKKQKKVIAILHILGEMKKGNNTAEKISNALQLSVQAIYVQLNYLIQSDLIKRHPKNKGEFIINDKTKFYNDFIDEI